MYFFWVPRSSKRPDSRESGGGKNVKLQGKHPSVKTQRFPRRSAPAPHYFWPVLVAVPRATETTLYLPLPRTRDNVETFRGYSSFWVKSSPRSMRKKESRMRNKWLTERGSAISVSVLRTFVRVPSGNFRCCEVIDQVASVLYFFGFCLLCNK